MAFIIRLVAALILLITAVGGYISFRYSTTSICDAAAQAIRAETPKAIDEMAERDLRFKALKVGGALFGGVDAVATGATTEMAARELADKSAVECAFVVGQRELNPSGFRKMIGDKMAAELDARRPF